MEPFHTPSPEHPWLLIDGTVEQQDDLTSIEAIVNAIDAVDAQRRTAQPDETPWVVRVSCAKPQAYLGMSLGVGQDRVPASFEADVEENYVSISDSEEERRRGEELTYKHGGDYLWASSAELIDYRDARAAVESFLRTGERPSGIRWAPA